MEIKTPSASLGVRGTEFIVDVDSTTNTTTVILLEGTIDATTDGETRTFSGENKFTVDSSGIIVDKVFSIYEWNGLSDEINPDSNSLTETEPNKIVSGDYLENIKIVSDNEEYFITANIGQKSPNTSSVRIIVENECPFKKEILVKDFQFRPGADVSFSFEQLSELKPSECSIHFTISAFDGRELETIVANYYLTIPDTESDYIECTAQWDPVCGVDDKTYSNDCLAYVSGVEISSLGECGVGDSLDSDGDGVPDSEDQCPELYGLMFPAGCPDVPLAYPPSAPTSLTVSATGSNCVDLFWETPDDEGGLGYSISMYIIEYKSESDSRWQVDDHLGGNTSAQICGLQTDMQYQFRVSGMGGSSKVGESSTTVTATPTAAGGGGCLIATATYGSELSPQVQQLREIRDDTLLNTESGKSFMGMFNGMYYSFSPVIADLEREHPLFKESVKLFITPMITSLSLMEYADSEESVLFIGVSLIILNGLMYFGIPGIVLVGVRKF